MPQFTKQARSPCTPPQPCHEFHEPFLSYHNSWAPRHFPLHVQLQTGTTLPYPRFEPCVKCAKLYSERGSVTLPGYSGTEAGHGLPCSSLSTILGPSSRPRSHSARMRVVAAGSCAMMYVYRMYTLYMTVYLMNSCQKCRIFTVYITYVWFWPTLCVCACW